MDKDEVAFITHISNMGNETIASISKHLNDSTTTIHEIKQNIHQAI